MASVIADIFNYVDQFGMEMVSKSYHQLVSELSPAIFSLTSIYLGLCFIKMQRGLYNFNDLFMIILRTVCILTLALNYNYFCLYIYDLFTKAPLELFHALVSDNNSFHGLSIADALDNFLSIGTDQAEKVFMMGSWSNMLFFLFGIVLFFMTILSVGMAASLIVLAKCASTILLSLSPLFIFFALYESTKGLFDAYIRQLLGFALIPVFTGAVLMILLSVGSQITQAMDQYAKPNFHMVIPFCLICIVQFYLLLQVRAKAAAVASGVTLPTVVGSMRQFKNDAASVKNSIQSIGRTLGDIGSSSSTSRIGRAPSASRFNKDK